MPPQSSIPADTNYISAVSPPPTPNQQEVAAASKFVLERASREDIAFTAKSNSLLECFDDLFPHGEDWLHHNNAKNIHRYVID